ncbi:MAG: PQQ-binding-like beta-propeller repeat protein, partial [Phycisphaerales bacterium]|nr:PQQ-binding-like beta-propeller repeat protein [Phycisphaerales bacterium]
MTVLSAFGPVASAQTEAAAQGPEVEESFAVGALFRTADDAVNRQDWKLAIDSLQRVIDAPEGLVAVEAKAGGAPARYVSPRWQAQRLLASLPADGLQAYRVLNDGRASALLTRGRRDMDLSALRELCARYVVSTHGREAVELLTSWLLDWGRASEALLVLQNYAGIFFGGSPLPASLELKRAVALMLLGDRDGGRVALDAVRAAAAAADIAPQSMDAVAALADTPAVTVGDGGGRTVWNGALGGGRCDGRMDAVVPSFAERLPWRRAIPSVASGTWPELDGLAVNMLPALMPVYADGRIYVRAGMEITALDVPSFSLLWESDPGAVGIAERAEQRARWTLAGERSLLSDYVAGALTIGEGHIYAVEREVEPAAFDGDGIIVIQPRNQPRRAPQPVVANRNRLVAYRTDTGALVWRRGGAWDGDERLREVQFLAPPVSAGGRLWVPFELAGDLFVGVLNPADGALVKQIVLCTLGGREVEPTVALFAAEADGMMYVPTGHGLLFALNVNEPSVVWASRYAEDAAPTNNRMRGQPVPAAQPPQEWLSGPPMVAGRWVVLAPTDAGDLIAFDRLDGAIAWRTSRMKHRYLVGSDGTDAWLGGNQISRVSLKDGSYLWTTAIEEPMGRAALCGEVLYVPTRKDLTAVDAASGAIALTYELPADQPPLGNLFCAGGSMISIDPSEVRAFPDRHSYESTLAAHRVHPTDARIGMRLAFMELLEGRPGAALEALDGVAMDESAGADSQKAHMAHLRVRALLQLGSAASAGPEEAVGYLERAVASAMNEQDRVSSRLALGDKLRKLSRHVEAYRALWSLSQEPVADTMVAVGSVQRPARLAIADTLRRIEPELGPSDVEDIRREAEESYRRAVAGLG